MERNEITIFGEDSIAHVKKLGRTHVKYAVVRDCDGVILAVSDKFKEYVGDTVRTMYTGSRYATGDYILVADTIDGEKEIYRWKDMERYN